MKPTFVMADDVRLRLLQFRQKKLEKEAAKVMQIMNEEDGAGLLDIEDDLSGGSGTRRSAASTITRERDATCMNLLFRPLKWLLHALCIPSRVVTHLHCAYGRVFHLLSFIIWLTIGGMSIWAGLVPAFLLCSLLAAMCIWGMRDKPEEEPSAYSVFNENCERIPGTFTAEQFEASLRRGGGVMMGGF